MAGPPMPTNEAEGQALFKPGINMEASKSPEDSPATIAICETDVFIRLIPCGISE